MGPFISFRLMRCLKRHPDVEDETISLDRVSQLIAPAKRFGLTYSPMPVADNPFTPGTSSATMASRIHRAAGCARGGVG